MVSVQRFLVQWFRTEDHKVGTTPLSPKEDESLVSQFFRRPSANVLEGPSVTLPPVKGPCLRTTPTHSGRPCAGVGVRP